VCLVVELCAIPVRQDAGADGRDAGEQHLLLPEISLGRHGITRDVTLVYKWKILQVIVAKTNLP